MAWIESHQNLADHPKTRKLARILGVSKPTVIGHLHCLWWWALDYADDGILDRYDDLDIAIGADWEGDPETFVAALAQSGFLDKDEDGILSVHDWEDYAGKLINRRRANALRMKEARAQSSASSMEEEKSTNSERATNVQRTQRARVERQDQTRPDQTGQEEKEGASAPTPSSGSFTRMKGGKPDAPAKPLPQNGPAQQIIRAFCEAIRIERPVNYGKAAGQAQLLADAGITPYDIPQIVTWLQGQKWVDGGIDLGLILNQADKWRATKSKPAPIHRHVV